MNRLFLFLLAGIAFPALVFRVSGDWNLVWNDEFSGTAIDTNHWTFETGNGSGGWGNNELEYYTSRPQNAYVANGLLHIVAQKESFSGFSYTSARMKTAGRFAKKFGRFEFRARLPAGQGYWPALWLMPEDSVYGGWAASGEIDVMENKGGDPAIVLGTIHFGGQYPANASSHGPPYTFPPGDSGANFHTYLLDWTNNAIRWSVDNQLYETQTNWWSSGGSYPAPFDQPFYLIMNLAVGGNFGGNPDAATVFPGEMLVDYIRVYDQTPPLQISVAQTNPDVVLTWPSEIVCHLQTQSNLGVITANWTDLPEAKSSFTVPSLHGNTSAFYRLVSP